MTGERPKVVSPTYFGAYGRPRVHGQLKSGKAFLRFVAEPALRRRLVERATHEQVTLSEVIRRACRLYVGFRE